MGSFGERLRREREMRGITLDDIAEATKIGTRLLRALEEEHFEMLPGGIFNKGFVRAYAKYLGLNEEEAVADYLAAAGESIPDPRVIAEQNASRIDRSGEDAGANRAPRFPLIPVLILLVVIAAGAGGWEIYQQRHRDRQAKEDADRGAAQSSPSSPSPSTNPSGSSNSSPSSGQTNQSATIETGELKGVGSQGATSAQPASSASSPANLNAPVKPVEPAAQQSGIAATNVTKATATGAETPIASTESRTVANAQTFEVEVRAKDRAWISIKSDGKFAVRGIIGPPEVKTVRATDQVIFYTGNAGAVEVSFNGQRVALPGGPNSEGVLVFNSHGVVIPKPAESNHEP